MLHIWSESLESPSDIISPSLSRVRMFFTMAFYAHVVREGCWGLHLASIYGFLSSFLLAKEKNISHGFTFLIFFFLHLHHNNRRKNICGRLWACTRVETDSFPTADFILLFVCLCWYPAAPSIYYPLAVYFLPFLSIYIW